MVFPLEMNWKRFYYSKKTVEKQFYYSNTDLV